jgi:UDP-GlcNAc3NAcA epimerase
MIKLLSIVGARPQFVKLAPLSRALRARGVQELIIHTGQHYSRTMSADFFDQLDIPSPDYNLAIGSSSHGKQTGRMLEALESVIGGESPAGVVVFGDTNSTLAGALAAAKLGIPVFHVEAGLRSGNRSMPEELNRIAADHLSDFLLAPTRAAMANLAKEGLSDRSVLTGDIMVDTVAENLDRARRSSDILDRLGLERQSYTLLTLHRPYNVDDAGRARMILERLTELPGEVVFPAHPRTRNSLERAGLSPPQGIRFLEPQNYLDFLMLESCATRIVTDSGGVQKEAYLLSVPCITIRPETEWVETVEQGWNMLMDPCAQDFVSRVMRFRPRSVPAPIFGSDVAQAMAQSVLELSEGGTLGYRAPFAVVEEAV